MLFVRLGELSMPVLVSVQLAVWVYVCVCIAYVCLRVCAYQEYMLSLATVCTWECAAVAAMPLSGFWIQHP